MASALRAVAGSRGRARKNAVVTLEPMIATDDTIAYRVGRPRNETLPRRRRGQWMSGGVAPGPVPPPTAFVAPAARAAKKWRRIESRRNRFDFLQSGRSRCGSEGPAGGYLDVCFLRGGIRSAGTYDIIKRHGWR